MEPGPPTKFLSFRTSLYSLSPGRETLHQGERLDGTSLASPRMSIAYLDTQSKKDFMHESNKLPFQIIRLEAEHHA